MEVLVVQTYVGTADKAITDKPTLVYFVFIEPLQAGSKSTLKIRDGFSTSDKEVARIETEYGRDFEMCPPMRCAHGLYIDIDAWVSSYTIGYILERIVKACPL